MGPALTSISLTEAIHIILYIADSNSVVLHLPRASMYYNLIIPINVVSRSMRGMIPTTHC